MGPVSPTHSSCAAALQPFHWNWTLLPSKVPWAGLVMLAACATPFSVFQASLYCQTPSIFDQTRT